MADSFRPSTQTSRVVTVILSCLLLLLVHANNALASPIVPHAPASFEHEALHWRRADPIVKTSDIGNNTAVFNPDTNQVIPQGAGTDGGGVDFSLPAIIWLAFVFVTGIPLALVGIRFRRVTTGLGVGLAVTVAVWAAFVNTVSADGLSDIVLTVISMGGFLVGLALGALDFGKWAGILMIGLLGGFSVGVRIVLLRPGLLIPSPYAINWLILVPFIVAGLAAVLVRQRLGLVSCCAAVGTFLVGLGIDLIIEKQSGMSFALRFLFDRNDSHFLDIVHRGYNPSLMTQIILGASVGAIPFLAYGQHKIFKKPFLPQPREKDWDGASLVEPEPGLRMSQVKETPRASRMALLKSRFSLA
ncbi:hypothetical protein C8Q76DRAFT_209992 [Earliella scabrosa]|nr:hypothetical protein C8Q76DRAFT_209992 [Earliella scabrosa]